MKKKGLIASFCAFLLGAGLVATPSFASAKTDVNVKTLLGDAYNYGIFVKENVTIYGDSEANICTENLTYNANIGKNGTIYVGKNYNGSGNNIRVDKLVLNKASFSIGNNGYYVNNTWIGTFNQVGSVVKGKYNIDPVIENIETNSFKLFGTGTTWEANGEGKYYITLASGQNILEVKNVKFFEPNVAGISKNSTAIINITSSDKKEFYLNGQSAVNGMTDYPNGEQASYVTYNFGKFNGTLYLTNVKGTIIAPKANVVLYGGNLSGRVIAKNFTSNSEVHFIAENEPEEEETTTPELETTTTVEIETTTPEIETTTPEIETTTVEIETTTVEIETTTVIEEETTTIVEIETTVVEEETTTIVEEETTTIIEIETTTIEEETTTTTVEEETTTVMEEETTTGEVEADEETTPEEETTTHEGEVEADEDPETGDSNKCYVFGILLILSAVLFIIVKVKRV